MLEVMDDREFLQSQIDELQFQLKQREEDLETYRGELVKANLELERLIVSISQQISTASKIQKLLIPTEYPNISGFEFSSKFIPGQRQGGDYFDVFEMDDKMRFGVVMASCSGYSMSALLLSVLLKFSGIAGQQEGSNIGSALKRIVDELASGMAETDQASLFYAVVDRRSFIMEYALLGPLLALFVEGETGKVRRLEGQGVIDKGQEFVADVQQVELNAKDRLVFGSQGLIEARSTDDEIFGTERAYRSVIGARHASVHDLRNEILYQLESFRNAKQFDRDVTVLVAEVKDRVIKLA